MTAPAFEEVPMPEAVAYAFIGPWKERNKLDWRPRNKLWIPLVRRSDAIAYGQQCRPAPCLWKPDADGYWKTACGQGHTFTTDGPAENNHRFCCYCGGRISMNGSGA